MAIREDPEGNEIRTLFEMVDFSGKHVFEIGCGDGRLTWRYADSAARVTALDPFEDWIRRAKETLPERLLDQVGFHNLGFEEYANSTAPGVFDIAILSWSL